MSQSIQKTAEASLVTEYGKFTISVYCDGDREQIVLKKGEWKPGTPVLARLHGECITGEVFHSERCDCREQLDLALQRIAQAGAGVVLYLRQEGRGIGLTNKIKAYALQDHGRDTVEANEELGLPADGRDYSVAAALLHDLGIAKVRLLTNNPTKVHALAAQGFAVERVSLETDPNEHNRKYLKVKKEKMGHLLTNVN